ncbi:BREX system ATP-binding protein BrxD [Accumulibacter sp.]|uniref:BREX system ATP-binding protein BrxD n=1 Tax=Accumulibacter sp. TaxID=2053492 RepID=UPI0025FA1490|nr:BREX system ATP-binding protein BrxD [Accumulibacter sp.]MCM8596147.1 BREX system ATP-binding protein BrxD [Accumulibacter sp.]MCM8625581.1 BREX system ATP-binding protein BrxD [Accumulibacter sp.]MDS4050296.1 BREX system ATP-binding protein BrxD [Accumulibacter sp.]
MISAARREDIVSALRRGTVPTSGLDALAVGIESFAPTLDEELAAVAAGRGGFKAVRGEYGTGKTFFGRWLQERARARGFAATEVQINETETPLHRLETVYRRLVEHLGTADTASGAFRGVIDGWFYALEQDVLADASVDPDDAEDLLLRTDALMEARLATISRTAPAFSAVLRRYRRALAAGDGMLAEGLISWLSGQPNVAASVRRAAGIKGDLDHFGATNFLVGLLTILRDSGFSGLVMMLDEVETLQRMRTDTREKGLNALRQWIDEIDAGRYPGLYLVVTGTPAFFDGAQGVQRLAPLAQRLHVDFATDRRFDNPRAVQIRLAAFDHAALLAVGRRVRGIYAEGRPHEQRLRSIVDDGYLDTLARAVAGGLGGKVGVAPRLFLKKLVADILDRVDLHEGFDPRRHYTLTLAESEMSVVERAAASARSVDDVELP